MAVYDWVSVQQTQNCLLPIYLYTLEKVTSLWVSERKLNDSKIPSNSEISWFCEMLSEKLDTS